MTVLYRKVAAMAAIPSETRRGYGGPGNSERLSGAAVFAGAVLMLSGPLSILMGASGIASDNLFAASLYAYRFDLTAWGWIHIVVGLALIIAGMGVVTNKSWGRGAGAAAAGISLITQFMFVPYYPLWAIPVMTLDLLVIFALTRFYVGTSGGR
ncbi:hypothetical protein GCM10022295_05790 [Streptomyces osmaniensis]|uniref:DUF7144 domain-containing protein n=2 Tax=Streptomyces osmaniensis TaxID=593134 RepID=A0ABP6V421_9ACTN